MLHEIEDKNVLYKKSKKVYQEALLNVDSYLFKTWIFGNKSNQNDDRYKTFEDAVNGHNIALIFVLDKMKNSGILG